MDFEDFSTGEPGALPALILRQTEAVWESLQSAGDEFDAMSANGIRELHTDATGFAAGELTELDIASERGMYYAANWLGAVTNNVVRFRGEELGDHIIRPHCADYDRPGLKATIAPGVAEQADITVIGDGVDGTSNLNKKITIEVGGTLQDVSAPAGAIVSVAEGNNPAYNDFCSAGIAMLGSDPGRTYGVWAQKGQGAYQQPLEDLSTEVNLRQLRTPEDIPIGAGTMVYAEKYDMSTVADDDPLRDYFALGTELAELLELTGLVAVRSGSTAGDIVDIVQGKVPATIQATRKGNQELPAMNLIVNEAGGANYAIIKGKGGEYELYSYGDEKFFEYAQNEHLPIISAASPAVAQEIVTRLNQARLALEMSATN